MEYIRKHWLGLSGLIISVLSLFGSYYFYVQSLQAREPVLVEILNAPIFSTPKEVKRDSFALVTKPNNEEVSDNVYLHEVAFWNKGKVSIKDENILSPLAFLYSDATKIIDAQIIESTRPQVIRSILDFKQGSNKIEVGFNILEKNDGFKIRVIHSGKAIDKLTPNGIIEGVDFFFNSESIEDENIFIGYAKTIMTFFVVFVLFISFILVIFVFDKYLISRFFPKFSKNVFDNLMMIIMVIAIIYAFINQANEITRNETKRTIPQMTSAYLSSGS